MNQEELYEKIERYLDGTLSGSVLAAFEKQLREDKHFAKEVELHRRLYQELGDTKKMELRGILNDLGKEVDLSDNLDVGKGKSNFGNWLVGLGGIVLVAGLGWILSRGGEERPEQKIAENNVETPVITDSTESDAPLVNEEKKEAPKKIASPRQESQKNIVSTPRSINNTPNPFFETILDSLENNRLYQFELDGQIEHLPQDRILLTIAGTLETAALKKTDRLTLKAYLNQKNVNFETKPYFTGPVEAELIEESNVIAFASKKKYAVRFSQTLTLEPGLYYYFIGKQDNFDPVYGGKFERGVKNN